MSANTTVKYFHAQQPSAPTVNGTQGTLISMLDACLVNGFGLKSVDSLVVSDGIATATISTGHSLQENMVGLFAGATPTGLNGEKRILSTTNTTVTFDATGISDQTATGTITVKVAPLGWDKVYSATNVAVYRPASSEATRFYLRVDESTSGVEAEVQGYETMTDATTGTKPFPYTTGYWPKSSDTTTDARDWTVIGDHRTVHVHLNCVSTTSYPDFARLNGNVWSFGDFKSLKPADANACAIHTTNVNQYYVNNTQYGSLEYTQQPPYTSYNNQAYAPRNALGVGSPSNLFLIWDGPCQQSNNSGHQDLTYYAYPNTSDNSLMLWRGLYVEFLGGSSTGGNANIRGRTRGVYRTPQKAASSFSQRDIISGTGDLAGRKLLAVRCGAPNRTDATATGVLFFDVTGPWEV